MTKKTRPQTVTGEMAKAPTRSALNESNENSYLTDHGRSVEKDYYRLENREKQLKALASMSAAELSFITGTSIGDSESSRSAAAENVKKGIVKLHEQDMLEMKALYYLNGLADTSPEYGALKTMTGGHSREEVARHLAEKQMKKLYMSQVEKILASDSLAGVYGSQMVASANKFKGLFGGSA